MVDVIPLSELNAADDTGVKLSPKERRLAAITERMGGTLAGWNAVQVLSVSEDERDDKDNKLQCDGSRARAWRLLVVNHPEVGEKNVGFGFARKYLDIDVGGAPEEDPTDAPAEPVAESEAAAPA